ncbi:MAG: glycosyltransferase family 39 protein [Bacteroidales bacterium]|nr:glycosyltransferase family 39 protein [Bacteroidales bacterium]
MIKTVHNTVQYHKIILTVVFVILACLILFPRLSSHPLFEWDESRLAVNAYEMSKSNNPIVTTFESSPDTWNTKPPLLICVQALFIKVLSPTEWVLRLPSCIAFLVMCFSLMYMGKTSQDFYMGLFSSLVCLSTPSLFAFHCFRSGDYESFLLMFYVLYLYSFFLYTETDKRKYLTLFFVFLSLCSLTKGIQAFITLPILIVYLAYRKRLLKEIKNKNIYIGIAVCVFVLALYYIAREIANPGFLKKVLYNEVSGRYLSALEGHKEDYGFYFRLLYESRFVFWLILLPIALVSNLFIPNQRRKNITVFFSLTSLFYLVVITFAQTKLEWYLFPVLPMFAIIIGTFLANICTFCLQNTKRYISIPILLLIAFMFVEPYKQVTDIVFHEKSYRNDERYYSNTYLMRDIAKNKINIKDIVFLNEEKRQDMVFYYEVICSKKDNNSSFVSFSDLKEGMNVMISSWEKKEMLQQNFSLEELYSKNDVQILRINKKLQ